MALQNTPTPVKLSTEAAQALYEKIVGFDRLIDAEIERVKAATAAIAGAYSGAGEAYEKRQLLAAELDRLAAAEFTPREQARAGAWAPPSGRWNRPHPFPQPRTALTRDDEERF